MDQQFQEAARLHQAGNFAAASERYQEILRRNPRDVNALCSLAFCCFQTGKFEESQRLFGAALTLQPTDVNAWVIRGVALLHLNRQQEALACFDSALTYRPDFLEALTNRATALMELGRTEEALVEFNKVLAMQPGHHDTWSNRGNCLMALGRPEEALVSFDRAVTGNPHHMLAWSNRGAALIALRRYDESVASFDRALALDSSYVLAWLARGEALLALWRDADALDSYERALALTGGQLDLALHGKAQALFRLGRLEESIAATNRLLELRPDYPFEEGERAFRRLVCCDWRFYDADRAGITAGIRAGYAVVNPWTAIILSDSPADQLACARRWAAQFPTAPRPSRQTARDRIRVAYLSSDFRLHVTAHLAAGLFEQHDRSRFETYGASFGHNDRSEMRARLERAFDHFLDVAGHSDEEVAQMLQREEIDIAIDLKGYTTESRPGIFAARPAPIQVSYLGYPGTMAAEFMDYLIADGVVVPPGAEPFYSEKLVRLPGSYFSYACTEDTKATVPTRKQAGLPDEGFVFCCFNNSYKLTPPLFALWMRLLKAVPGSVLWLLESNEIAVRNLRREALAAGIAQERLVFAPFLAMHEHRARYKLADLFIDTLPCNAHSTAAEALWAGLPVLTCSGEGFAARVASSLNQAVGLTELNVSSLTEYETLAVNLAREPAALARFRERLGQNGPTAPVFDSARLCRSLEAAYAAMHELRMRGAAPADIAVPAPG
jgi:predicted O-linked N-acetylglucosamine transferase (SPINDLY family)